MAVILCRFKDVPPMPREKYLDLVSGSPSHYSPGRLFEYWYDISYGTITLEGSKVYGWYDMKYSFVNDGRDPFKEDHLPPEKRKPVRLAWINEAKRLAKENGVDLSPFYGVIAVVNALVEDSALRGQTDMAISEGDRWGQSNWRWCKKCQGLAYAGGSPAGAQPHKNCPAGGVHDHLGSMGYAIAMNDTSFPGQNNWRWCKKCQGLAYAGGSSPGACPAGGVHDHSGSADYTLANFEQDKTFLIGSFKTGEVFKDDKRKVRISVDSTDSSFSTATITIHTS
jgi:hypothetical protein